MFEHIQDVTANVTFLPVPNDVQDSDKRVVYSVPVTAVAGDKMIFTLSGSVTNQHNFNVMLGRGAVLANTPTAVWGSIVLPFATENITPAIHHKIYDGSAVYTFQEAFTGHLNVVLYAGSSASAGHTVIVEQGYGRLDVAMFRAQAAPPVNPPSGSVTLTSEQASMIKAALLDGHAEREAASALL